MALLDYILGRPLASSEDKQESIGSFSGVSVFGLDALSSSPYGPESALTILYPLGIVKTVLSGGHPQPLAELPSPSQPQTTISVWLFLKAFAAGCTAMTGVEAVSNGVPVFKEPMVKSARLTLTFIVAILIILLIGIAYLVSAYHITATEPGSPNYQSILSLVTAAVAGRGVFYYLTMIPVLLVLCLSANTSFADFPRVCRTVSIDGFLPASFGVRGRRLVYTQGIVLLTALAGILLFVFNGVTDRLIPLFAVGAFLAFTLSQAGMVMHWLRSKEPNAYLSAIVNGIGAFATGLTLIIVIVTKFAEGAWLVLIVLPLLFLIMRAIEWHYREVAEEIAISGPVPLREPSPLIAVVPLDHLNTVSARALQAAFAVTKKVHVVHVEHEDGDQDFAADWDKYVKPSIRKSRLPEPDVVVLKSPYRKVVAPTLNYIWNLERENPDSSIVVLIPQLVESHWYYSFLHNQRASILRTVLLLKGRNRILIMNVPWHLKCQLDIRGPHRIEPWDQAPAWLDR